MPFEGFDSEDEGLAHDDAELAGRPYGARPYGVRPYGVRPYGVRPYGVRPYGVRPYGVRPYGVRPYGVRPYGVRPYGVREGQPGDAGIVAEEWAADISELVCERSAVIRLGATVVSDAYELRVPAVDATANAPAEVEEGAEKPKLKPRELKLRPRDHELATKVVLPDRLAKDIAGDAGLAQAVKEDLAEALALRADQAFLRGTAPQPAGIVNLVPGVPASANLLETARALVTQVRTQGDLLNRRFRAPGWILHPATLNDLMGAATAAGPTVDMVHNLLSLDGVDGGRLLGYPMIVSAAAAPGPVESMFFGADWREAWIGMCGSIVEIDISTHAQFQTDETVIRATIAYDFILRRGDQGQALTFAWNGAAAARRARRTPARASTTSRNRRSSSR